MSELIKVLSIDGGGIRGIIPAMILTEIEKRTQRQISDLFDLIVGTSTGGILALGLTKPGKNGNPQYTAEELMGLYEVEGGNIFSHSVWHRIKALGNLIEEKYPAEGIEKVLDKYFGATRLKDAITDVFITSYEIERRLPFFFRSSKAKLDTAYDFEMKKVARATSAAPTYFEPLKIETENHSEYYALIDGGVFANNPGLCGFVEAKTIYPEANDILMVSLGTGELTRRLPFDEVKGWGLARWVQPLLSVIFDGVSDTVNYQLTKILPETHYYRFQIRLDEGNDDMDDASRTNIRVLKLLAEAIIRDERKDLDNLVNQLV